MKIHFIDGTKNIQIFFKQYITEIELDFQTILKSKLNHFFQNNFKTENKIFADRLNRYLSNDCSKLLDILIWIIFNKSSWKSGSVVFHPWDTCRDELLIFKRFNYKSPDLQGRSRMCQNKRGSTLRRSPVFHNSRTHHLKNPKKTHQNRTMKNRKQSFKTSRVKQLFFKS